MHGPWSTAEKAVCLHHAPCPRCWLWVSAKVPCPRQAPNCNCQPCPGSKVSLAALVCRQLYALHEAALLSSPGLGLWFKPAQLPRFACHVWARGPSQLPALQLATVLEHADSTSCGAWGQWPQLLGPGKELCSRLSKKPGWERQEAAHHTPHRAAARPRGSAGKCGGTRTAAP